MSKMPRNRLGASNMGYGSTFYADEPEDLAYLKQLAKDSLGDENKWPDLHLKIHGRPKKQENKMTVIENIRVPAVDTERDAVLKDMSEKGYTLVAVTYDGIGEGRIRMQYWSLYFTKSTNIGGMGIKA